MIEDSSVQNRSNKDLIAELRSITFAKRNFVGGHLFFFLPSIMAKKGRKCPRNDESVRSHVHKSMYT